MLRLALAAHDDRPAGPRGAPAGRGVLAHFGAGDGARSFLLIVWLALGACGSGATAALSASLDSLVFRVIAGEALAGPIASFHEVPLLAG